MLRVLDSSKQRLTWHTGDRPDVSPVGLRSKIIVWPSGVETPHIGLDSRWIGEQFLHSGAICGVVEKAGFQ